MPSVIHRWRLEAANLALHPAAVSWSQLLALLNKTGYLFIWIPMLLSVRGLYLASRHPALHTRRILTAQTLPWVMSKHSPAVIPVLYYGDLLNEDPLAQRSALTPDEWVQQRGVWVNGVCLTVPSL